MNRYCLFAVASRPDSALRSPSGLPLRALRSDCHRSPSTGSSTICTHHIGVPKSSTPAQPHTVNHSHGDRTPLLVFSRHKSQRIHAKTPSQSTAICTERRRDQIWPVCLNVLNFIFRETDAIRSGNSPAPFLRVRSAPARSRAFATSVRLKRHAMCKGVLP